ncbi:MAG: hypothetical protein ACI8RZ_001657 [Myxococcota bacterium]|jgi:hypothetical protein
MSQFSRSFFLVGINDYTHSSRDLRGCVNDVIDGICYLLDIHHDMSNVVACTSPMLTAEEVARAYAGAATDPDHATIYSRAMARLSGVTFSGATRSELLGGAATAFKRSRKTGFVGLYWSGHGQLIDGRYHFAPADAAGEDRPGAAETMIRYADLLSALGLGDDDSLLALLDTCDAGSVHSSDYTDRPDDLILTSGGPTQEISERYIGGQWRGLMNWAFHRVLEQYNFVRGGPSSGADVSYGNLVRDVRALIAIFQGVEVTPSVPQLHGKMASDPLTLHRCVGQNLTAPPGRSSYRADVIGHKAQMWGDVDTIVVYELKVNTTVVARIFINGSAVAHDVSYVGGSVNVKTKEEVWIFLSAGLSNLPSSITSYTFTLLGTYSNSASPVSTGLSMTGYATASPGHSPMIPNWGTAVSQSTAGYQNHNTGSTYAFKLSYNSTSEQVTVAWLRSGTTPTPFKVAGVNPNSVAFDNDMTGSQTVHRVSYTFDV